MKTINYTGSSKLISRIVHLLNRKAPLPLDGQGDAVWGTNGQVLTTDGQGNTSWTTPQGGGGDVTDVEVNGTSVVNAQGVAEVSVPTNTSDLNNDSDFIDSTDLSTALGDYTPTANLATVATSGDYSDLQNKPTIPDELADLADDSTHRTVTDTQISTWNGKSDFSGSYNDLTDKPTIPTVNDGTLTIQQNGTTVGTFSANQSGNTTVNLTGGGGSTYTEGDGIDISSQNVISVDTTFTEASTRANIASGDSFSTILGKIKKFFTDLKTVAFTGSYDDLSNKPTIPADNSVKDYNNNTPTKFGYSTSGMSQADAVWLGAWDASASGEYRLRAVQQANLKVAEATKATQDGSGNVITSTYVKKSGDTMTGALTVQRNSDTPLVLERTDSNGKTYVAFRNTSGIIGYFAVGNDKKPYFYDNADRRIALLEEVTSGYIPYIFGGSKYQAYADGSHQWFRMAILTVTGTYLNAPITFEVSSRGRGRHSQISVMFLSAGNTDPGLSSITTDFDPSWYIKKTATSTWELYVNTGGGWNSAWIHRCFGKYLNGGVTVTFPVDALSAAPTGITQASYGGNVDYATSAGKLTYASQSNFLSIVAGSGYSTSNDYSEFMRYGNIVHARFNLKMSSQQATRTSRSALGGVSAQFKPSVDTASVAQIFCGSTYVNAAFVFLSNGSIRVDTFDVAIPANTWMDVICIYGLRS